MAREISIKLFEKNLKSHNKQGLERSYYTIENYTNEYVKVKPLGSTTKYAIQVVIDKEFVKEFQTYLKKKKFEILGTNNYYHIGCMLADYYDNEANASHIKEQMEAIEKDYTLMKDGSEPFELIENDDAKFYFLPYNEKCETLCDFIETIKTGLIKFAKNRDITIVMNIIPYNNMLTGGFVFNAVDENDNTYDFVSNMVLSVDFDIKSSGYAAALLMCGIAKNSFDLETLNFHIIAENLKYEK